MKNLRNLTRKMVEENRVLILIDCLRIRTRDCWRLWIRSLSTTSTSGAMKGTAASKASVQHPNFYLSCWLFCLDGRAFVLALWGSLAWILVERSLGVERLLSASPDAPYERCWSTSGGVLLPMKAPRCFLPLGSPSTKRGNRALAFDCCLPIGHTLHCQWLL